MMQTVNILGSYWVVEIKSSKEDDFLLTSDGYCDKTSRKIVVCTKEDDCELDNFEAHQKKVMRHEIIHAFLFESGLGDCVEHKECGHEETFVDWLAYQFPKIVRVFEELKCL